MNEHVNGGPTLELGTFVAFEAIIKLIITPFHHLCFSIVVNPIEFMDVLC
jgi:hypothetical protein